VWGGGGFAKSLSQVRGGKKNDATHGATPDDKEKGTKLPFKIKTEAEKLVAITRKKGEGMRDRDA